MNKRPNQTQTLPVPLTLQERELKGRELAEATLSAEQLTGMAKEMASDFKGKLAKLADESKRLAGIVTSGHEDQAVECSWRLERRMAETAGPTWVWVLERTDTGEVVRTEAAVASDLQEDLPAVRLVEP